MKKLTVVAAGALCACFAQRVPAEGLSALPYTGIQASYAQTQFDGTDDVATGVGLAGSFAVGSNVFISGSYESAEITSDFGVFAGDMTLTLAAYSVGLGYHHALNPAVDLVPSISLIDAAASFEDSDPLSSPDQHDTGWSAGLALRALVTPRVELQGGFQYVSLYDDGGTSFEVQAHYYPVDKIGLGIACDVSDDARTVGLVVTALFGKSRGNEQ